MSRSTGEHPKQELFEQTLAETGSVAAARRAIGHSPAQANKGRHDLAIPLKTAAELWEQAQEKIKLGQQLTKESANNLIKGSLARVVIEGKDADVVSAAGKLGQHRDVDAFQSEQTVGIMMVMPPNVLDMVTERLQAKGTSGQLPPVIDAESVVPSVTKE